jgi:fused signal recognition particle receptor
MFAAHLEALVFLVVVVGIILAVTVGVIVNRRSKNRSAKISEKENSATLPVPSEEISILSKAPAKELVEVAIADEIKKVAPVVQEDPFAQSKSLKQALSNTEKSIWGRLAGIFSSETEDQHFDELEEILYTSDIGPQTVERLMESVRAGLSRAEKKDLATLKKSLKSEFLEIFENANIPEPKSENPFAFLKLDFKPAVWMIVGVNGAGKTTSIGKLAAHLAKDGKKVLVAAGDTFRAAAGNQLRTWTDRAQVEIFSPEGVTDPSAVAFDAVAKAKAQGYDVVIVDTAGRLHTQSNLMEELKKMKRVMTKVIPDAPHETLIVLDANSGQNALVQAKEFHQALGLTGVILTKMDGTAKGGVAVGLANELKIPIRLIGVGEKIGDLRPFSAQEFINALF